MQTELIPQQKLAALAYLDSLGELNAEVQIAMEAIGANALSALEESVSRQHVLCGDLQRLARQLTGRATKDSHPEPDALLAHRIRLASESLEALNLRYRALLQHSTHSVRLFASLCRDYTEHCQAAPSLQSAQPEWSC